MVKRLPANLDASQSRALLEQIEPFLQSERPHLVFDFTDVRHMGSAGVEMLLRCMEAAMKRNGDLKLAAVSPEQAVILEMTRVDRLFEIFDSSADAVESFHRFSTASSQSKFEE